MASTPNNYDTGEGKPNMSEKTTYQQPKEASLKSDSSSHKRKRMILHLVCWLILTGGFITAMVLHREKGVIMPTVLYVFITLKLFFEHVSTSLVTGPIGAVWAAITGPFMSTVPSKVRAILGIGLVAAGVALVLALNPESSVGNRLDRLRSLGGLLCFIGFMAATSNNRRAIQWRIVVVGTALQFLIGLFILKTSIGLKIFSSVAHFASSLLEFSSRGAAFVFGEELVKQPIFAIAVLPGVLFFASFISILYYVGAMQWLVKKVAWLMVRLMDTSGAESVVAAASPFVGQGESALLVKPFISTMTTSELHSTMCSGFATIAGSVLMAFVAIGVDAQALITACVMSTPCSLVVSKLRYPETEVSISKGQVHIPEDEDRESNVLHAAANGAAQGTHLVALIVGTLIAIISLLALVNSALGWVGGYFGAPNLTLVMVTRPFFVPFAFLIGIPTQDLMTTAGLMSEKMFVNEFAAFMDLAKLKTAMSVRGQLLSTFALCGFANFASIGIQIGCIGAMAPERKADLARLAFSAMLCGTMSTFMTATIAGILL